MSNNKEYGCHLLAQPKESNVHANCLFHDPNPNPETEIQVYKSHLCLGVTKSQKPLCLNDLSSNPETELQPYKPCLKKSKFQQPLRLSLALNYRYSCLNDPSKTKQLNPRLNAHARAQEYGCHLLVLQSGPVLNLTLPYLEKLTHQAVEFLLHPLYPSPGVVGVAKSQQPPRLNEPTI